MALTLKQARFVAEYTKTGNATQSAIAAGYSEATAMQAGSRLLRHVEVNNALVEVQTKALDRIAIKNASENAIASAAWIVEKAAQVVEIGTQAVPLRDREGEVLGYAPYNLPAVNGALTLLAKMHPEFSDKLDARVLHGIVKVERLTRGLGGESG